MDDENEIAPPPSAWLAALERGRADLAAGRTVPIDTVLAGLRESLDRLEARRAEKVTDAV